MACDIESIKHNLAAQLLSGDRKPEDKYAALTKANRIDDAALTAYIAGKLLDRKIQLIANRLNTIADVAKDKYKNEPVVMDSLINAKKLPAELAKYIEENIKDEASKKEIRGVFKSAHGKRTYQQFYDWLKVQKPEMIIASALKKKLQKQFEEDMGLMGAKADENKEKEKAIGLDDMIAAKKMPADLVKLIQEYVPDNEKEKVKKAFKAAIGKRTYKDMLGWITRDYVLPKTGTKTIHTPIKQTDEIRYAVMQKTNTYKELDKDSQFRARYTNLMREWLASQTDAKIEKVGLIVSTALEVQSGAYNPFTHAIQLYGNMTKEDKIAAAKLTLEKQVNKAFVSTLTDELLEEMGSVIEDTLKIDGPRVAVHELVHANTVRFMQKNPEHAATKRVNELYARVKKERALVSGLADNNNWEKDVYEFVAEGLSDPKFIEVLANIDVTDIKPLGMLQELIKSIVDMLGLKPKSSENVYNLLLDSVITMTKEQNTDATYKVGLELLQEGLNGLKAGTYVPDQQLTDKQISEIEARNEAYLKANKDVKVVEGKEYEWKDGVVTVLEGDTRANRAVYLAHELYHDKTAQWLEDNKDDADVKRFARLMNIVRDRLEVDTYKEDLTERQEEIIDLLNERLRWDSRDGEMGLLKENVAILLAEPNVQQALEEYVGKDRRSIVQKVMDKLKEWLFAVKEERMNYDEIMKLVKGINKRAIRTGYHTLDMKVDQDRVAAEKKTKVYAKLSKTQQTDMIYTNIMTQWLKNQTTATIKEVSRIFSHEYVLQAGSYDSKRHEIKIAGKPSLEDMQFSIKNQLVKELNAKYGEAAEAMIAQLREQDLTEVSEELEEILEVNKPTVVLHELVHANTTRFMLENPDHKATKRMQELYELAKKHEMLQWKVGNGYWLESIDEFIAEGLSNQELMKEFMQVEVTDKQPLGLFGEVIRAIASMLGSAKDTENVYTLLLDGVMVMMKEQNGEDKFNKGLIELDQSTKLKNATVEELLEMAEQHKKC